MGEFKRGLDPACWRALDELASEGDNWWSDLLSLWVPSGEPAGAHGLRLALRDGYLNLYRRGQSVARVCFGPRRDGQVKARMEIHAKYVWCNDAPDGYQGCSTLSTDAPLQKGIKALQSRGVSVLTEGTSLVST